MFKRVLITDPHNKERTFIKNEEDYQIYKDLKKGYFYEILGLPEYQVKPYFDVDGRENFDYKIFDEIEEDLKKIIDVPIYSMGRKAREEDGVIKHSRRYYIKARITFSNIPIVFKELFDKYKGILDDGVYDKNRKMMLPLTNMKLKLKVPQLKLIKGSIFDNCASWIEEDYEDLDSRISTKKSDVDKLLDRLKDEDIDDSQYDGKLNFTEIMTKLSKERATEFSDWKDIGIALINLNHRKIISRGQLYDLFDLFSLKADNYDVKGVNNFIETNIPRFDGKGYGIKFLLECLKVDDEEYYKSITKKDLLIESANDDIGASKIVVEYYKDILVICNGVLYVKYEDIWVCDVKSVDNILIGLIGALSIKFIGVDGKRKYHYNKSIKHIRDCIVCIHADTSIINNNFYKDMINNNKFYLPFRDGIYSFKDKKLMTYNDLPNIKFTFKINRNFPKFIQEDYDELIKRVINPIYPIKEEAEYNAHIKARALAGCYKDKKWYGYSGSRNSGKGTETDLLKDGFGNYVMTFNAKCLILNKLSNPDCAKALNWVVDKKDARIIISNEIDSDNNTILNGAFIKTLASGGDEMEGRRLYENSVSFIPQFTMFLCYNDFKKVEPHDAMENLEQFQYKSKFVKQEELIEGSSFLKLADENIKDFIKEPRIIDAYTLYILNAFKDPRMKTLESVKITSENDDIQMPIETFIIKNFIKTNNPNDRLHTETITTIINDNGYDFNKIEVGRLMKRINIAKFNDKCNINGERKCGYDFIRYIGEN